MNPSQVFFGESLINGVFPKKNPKKYAAISLMTISEAGRRNLNTRHMQSDLLIIKKPLTNKLNNQSHL